ncbi:hypothetical protein QTP88_024337 [Uroleucon formosanum]
MARALIHNSFNIDSKHLVASLLKIRSLMTRLKNIYEQKSTYAKVYPNQYLLQSLFREHLWVCEHSIFLSTPNRVPATMYIIIAIKNVYLFLSSIILVVVRSIRGGLWFSLAVRLFEHYSWYLLGGIG